MTEQIAVFRSRGQAVDCNMRLRKSGIPSNLINTPKEAGIGCGLSVRLPKDMLGRAKNIIYNAKYSAFYGFITVKIY